eukprot:PhF_6_TR29496/c0_g1_i1/m.43678/K20858/MCU; calcium uniporter protein, mitochondrial
MMRRTQLFRKVISPVSRIPVINTVDYLTKLAKEKSISIDQAELHLTQDDTVVRYRIPGHVDIVIEEPENVTSIINSAMSLTSLAAYKKGVMTQLSDKKLEFTKLSVILDEIEAKAAKLPNRVAWLTFIFLVAQWGLLFNWVFITFDWNLVEPITYFLGYTVVWMSILHYYATGREYTYDNVREMLISWKTRKLIQKRGFDLAKFNTLKEEIASLEKELAALGNIDC